MSKGVYLCWECRTSTMNEEIVTAKRKNFEVIGDQQLEKKICSYSLACVTAWQKRQRRPTHR
jgi:hypothetical protein